MADALTLYLFAVAGLGACFFVAFVYYEVAAAPGQILTERGLTPGRVAVALAGAFSAVLAAAAAGQRSIPTGDAFEGFAYVVLAWDLLVLFGLLGLAGSYGIVRRSRRVDPERDVPTGQVDSGAVACTGTVTDERVDDAPVSGRTAVAWSWTVEVLDPHGAGDVGQRERWATMAGETGGVTFAVDDGTGPVWVDPAGATMDLVSERTLALSADEAPPESFSNPAPAVEQNHRERARRYHESLLAPGDQIALAGTARTEDGRTLLGGDDLTIAVGTLATAADRYRSRAVTYATGGLLAVAVGSCGLAGTFGVL